MNTRHLNATSISRAVVGRVRAPGFRAHVLHAFPRAINLLADNGTVVTLADPAVGDGPLNVVAGPRVDTWAPFAGVSADDVAWADGRCLHVGELTVTLAGAAVWEPRWAWERRQDAGGRQWAAWPPSFDDRVAQVVQPAVENLRAALRADDRAGLAKAAAMLAGLGPGLTPAGDDFLAGVLWGLRFWPGGRDVPALCAIIVAATAPRTTPLSAALLRAAGAGLADARWHALFDVLDRGHDATAAIRAVVAQGATSGTDTWAGFHLVASIDTEMRQRPAG